MANVEINDLTSKATVEGTDEFELQETAGGNSKKSTIQSVWDNAPTHLGYIQVTASGTLTSSAKVSYVTATTATVQTFPTSGHGILINDGDGTTVGVMTLTPPSGKKFIRENGSPLTADQVLYSAGDYAEQLEWNIDYNGNVRILKEGGTFTTA